MRINPQGYWTVFALGKLWPIMTFSSILRLRTVLGRMNKGKARWNSYVLLRMTAPTRHRVRLREGWPDLDSFLEIFIKDVYGIVADHMTDCRTIIDLGGNIGMAALYFAIRFPRSVIVSVEPHPQNFQLLQLNLEDLISSKRCVPIHGAVWSSEINLAADRSKPPGLYNAFAVHEASAAEGTVNAMRGSTMSAIVRRSGFGTVDLVKADIEGAERELFRGDLGWLRKTHALAIEFHGNSRKESCFDEIMRDFGFRILDDSDHPVFAIK